jgi:preprotein translocase subunit YajC
MPSPEREKKPRRGHHIESLAKGDTIFVDGPARITMKKTGANGGRVRVVVTADKGTKVKTVKRKVIRRGP